MPNKPFVLNVMRFDLECWIGAFGTTIIGALVLHMATGNPDDRNFPGTSCFITWLVVLPTMIVGAILSGVHLRKNLRMRDPNRILGSSLGLLLCSWPFCLAAAACRYYRLTTT